jgi:hypothetical protein
MLIYLDNCCFNRPYDDQSYSIIFLETQAKLGIQENILSGKYQLVGLISCNMKMIKILISTINMKYENGSIMQVI